MTFSMHWHLTALSVAASIISFVSSTDVMTQARVTVPAAVLAAAEASPVELVMALANASVPAGLEIREPDDLLPAGWPTVNGQRPAWFNANPTARIPASQMVNTFNRSQSDYRAVLIGEVVIIRPVRGSAAFLDQPSTISGRTTVLGAMAGARRIFADLEPGLSGPVLNSFGRQGDDVPVVVDGRASTVIDTLNQIVLQASPRAWVVTTRQEPQDVRIISFGFIERDGSRRIQRLLPR